MNIKEIKDRFITDRNFAIGKTLFAAMFAIVIFSLFLSTKIVSEVVTWYESDRADITNTISVEATGEIVAVPDVATFSFGIIEESESVESAQSEASKTMNLAIALLSEKGVDGDDIKTIEFSVNPKYEYGFCRGFDCPPQTRELVGYEVSQSVQVKVRDTSKAGEILAGITALEVSSIGGLNFTIDDTDALKAEARSIAVKNAKDKAEKLAKDLGVKLKKVVSFSEDGDRGGPFYAEVKSFGIGGGAASVIPDLPAGENTITSRVYITYEIK